MDGGPGIVRALSRELMTGYSESQHAPPHLDPWVAVPTAFVLDDRLPAGTLPAIGVEGAGLESDDIAAGPWMRSSIESQELGGGEG